MQKIRIEKGDWGSLANALESLGVKATDLEELEGAIKSDTNESGGKAGKRVGSWLKNIGAKLGDAGLGIGVEIAKTEATKWVHQFLGN